MSDDLFYPKSLQDALDDSYWDDSSVSAIQFFIHNRPTSQESEFERIITLYMPESMENPTNVTWESAAANAAGEAATGGSTLGGVAGDRLARWFKGNAIGSLGNLVGSGLSGEEIISLNTKTVSNPYMKTLFRGSNFRNFEFLFKFTPHNDSESATIHEIIQEFRRAALPNGLSTDAVLGWPKELEINYVYQGEQHPWLNMFKRCVITDLNVNYTGSGFYASMRDGFPAETELRLQFSEIEKVNRQDVTTTGPSY